jgi:hypothetical protein
VLNKVLINFTKENWTIATQYCSLSVVFSGLMLTEFMFIRYFKWIKIINS